MTSKFVFGTVVHPQVLVFFPEFIHSLKKQTDQQFHLLIINDGCNKEDLYMEGLEFSIVPGGGSITENRETMLKAALEKEFDWIIFGDSDDYFDKNRIAVVKAFAQKYDLISNEIIPLERDHLLSAQFQKALGDFSEINTVFIRDKNLFGFSNAACKLEYLKVNKIPAEIIAVDWYLFAKAIQSGAKACFTAKTNTYYRQWQGNIIGMNKDTVKQIKTGIKAKYFHYKNMLHCDPWYGGELPWLKNLYYQSDSKIFHEYYQLLEQKKENFTFWWENIKNYQL
jgi:glycosyltransferase involved in cell wall biosynthesis